MWREGSSFWTWVVPVDGCIMVDVCAPAVNVVCVCASGLCFGKLNLDVTSIATR